MKSTPQWMTVPAVFCAILFGFTLSLSLLAFNLENQLFNPAVYKNALSDQRVCERLPLVLAKQLTSTTNVQDGGNFISQLVRSIDPERLEGLFKMVLPCQTLEKVVFGAIDQVFLQLNGATAQSGFSLTPIKEIISRNSDVAVDEYLSSLPECTPMQLLEIGANVLLGQSEGSPVILCNPPALVEEAIKYPLRVMLDSAIQGMPDNIQVASALGGLLNTLRIARLLMNLSPLLPLLFLGLTTFFAVRSWRSLLRWWGMPLLASGVVTLIASVMVSPVVFSMFTLLILPSLPATIVPEAVKLISDVFAEVSQGLASPIQIQSAIISLMGLAMVLGEKLTRSKSSS